MMIIEVGGLGLFCFFHMILIVRLYSQDLFNCTTSSIIYNDGYENLY